MYVLTEIDGWAAGYSLLLISCRDALGSTW